MQSDHRPVSLALTLQIVKQDRAAARIVVEQIAHELGGPKGAAAWMRVAGHLPPDASESNDFRGDGSGGWVADPLFLSTDPVMANTTGYALCSDGTGWATVDPAVAMLDATTQSCLSIDGVPKVMVDATTFYRFSAEWRVSALLSNFYSPFGGVARATTTDATAANLATFTIPSGISEVVAEVQAIKSDGSISGVWYIRRRCKNLSGTVTFGTARVDNDDADGMTGCVVAIDNSGTTGRIRFTGLAATTIKVGVTWQVLNKAM